VQSAHLSFAAIALICSAYLGYLYGGQFRVWVALAAYRFGMLARVVFVSLGRSSFRSHIGKVIQVCTKEDMIRVAAGWVIARVAGEQLIRDRAMLQLPCKAVRPMPSACEKSAIAAEPCFSPCPYPATFRVWRFIDLRPEARLSLIAHALMATWIAAKSSCAAIERAKRYLKVFAALFTSAINHRLWHGISSLCVVAMPDVYIIPQFATDRN